MDRPTFSDISIKEVLGFTFSPKGAGAWEGWGGQWISGNQIPSFQQPSNSLESLLNIRKIGNAGPGNTLMSSFRVFSGVQSVLTGFSDGGFGGALAWGASEVITSGIVGSAAASGVSTGGQIGIGIGGGIGTILSGGSPIGNIVGQATASFLMQSSAGGALAGAAIGIGGPLMLGAATALGATYLAGRGSYEVMKAGYARRQRLTHSIDTAGSMAAFMNKNAFTMRGKAIAAIRNNHLNARSAFGQEAKRVHFSSSRKFINNGLY